MTTTTSIRILQNEHNLLQSNYNTFTNEQIINAAAIVAYRNGCKDVKSLYDAIYDECDMSLAATLNEMDKEELLSYAETHS
jgi:hypothetical protein